jgi:hypothetical protein
MYRSLAALALALLVGCTIAPKPVTPAAVSAAGLGVIAFTNGVWLVNGDTATEYTALAPQYGQWCDPPMIAAEGISKSTNGLWVMTPTAMKALGYMRFYQHNPALVPE